MEENGLFSGDGRRLAYIAIRENKYFVVLDGQESKEYDGVNLHSLRFSRDGKHFAYVAVRDRKHFVVRDVQEGKAYDGGLDTIFFSPDDRHLAYAVETGAHTRWVLDDRECREYDSMANNWACFSPDSKHFAYGAIRASKVVLVVDEQELGDYYGNLGTLGFDGPGLLRGVASRMDEKFDLEIVRLEVEMLPR